MKKLLALALLGFCFTANQANIAQNICEYTSVDDKKRLRSFLKTNRLKIRRVYANIQCNGQNPLVFADTVGALMVGELMISKLPKSVVEAEIPKLNNHHLIESAQNRVED